ncbi:MAG: DUF2752 domain-containing protein [Chloroflexi bacterium]|nr:DUF2752 domain-containing protein [Chloroflexota bacterium]MYK60507.1 DUF2752 domain-containing protein [Chloroflexota bacterium]
MDSGMKTMRGLLRYVDREAAIWVAALVVLALGNPNSDFHFTIFWPYYVWGIKSPGYGLGHSISYLFRGDVISAIETHILGIPAVAIILWRVITLEMRLFKSIRSS